VIGEEQQTADGNDLAARGFAAEVKVHTALSAPARRLSGRVVVMPRSSTSR